MHQRQVVHQVRAVEAAARDALRAAEVEVHGVAASLWSVIHSMYIQANFSGSEGDVETRVIKRDAAEVEVHGVAPPLNSEM